MLFCFLDHLTLHFHAELLLDRRRDAVVGVAPGAKLVAATAVTI